MQCNFVIATSLSIALESQAKRLRKHTSKVQSATKTAMAMGRSSPRVNHRFSLLLAALIVLSTLLAAMPHAAATDPDPLQDYCIADLKKSMYWTSVNGYPCKHPAKVTNQDFYYSGLRKGGDPRTKFGAPLTRAFVQEFPGLNTQGISMGRIDYAVDGLNSPHWHPRASEILSVIEGKLFAAFVDAEQNLLWYFVLEKGDICVFPRGLVHFQLNVGKTPAISHIFLNSQYAGQQIVGSSTFGSHIQDRILRKGFDLDESIVKKLKKFFITNTPSANASALYS